MPSRKRPIVLVSTLAVLCGFFIAPAAVLAASKFKVLHAFNGKNGANPVAGLIFDPAGNIYGTTYGGGAHGFGTVFQLTPGANGKWTEKVLHSFNGNDGVRPHANLVIDAAGILYGTTTQGGARGSGLVFELTPGANGKWTEKRLYSFCSISGCKDGANPIAGLVFDAAGNIYGTTYGGGAHGFGTVFQLTPGANGKWTEKVLHSFNDKAVGGIEPYASLILDAGGSLYGTTISGGGTVECSHGCGVVYQLTPQSNGKWTETVLNFFTKRNGSEPFANLIFDAAGSLFGTTYQGGLHAYAGTVFQLTPGANGTWTATLLHGFANAGFLGYQPTAGLTFDAAGNLYGTTTAGGKFSGLCFGSTGHGCGVVFQLSPAGNGKWSETVLHSFNKKDGADPEGGIILDSAGNLYGTAQFGGGNGEGVVFEITP